MKKRQSILVIAALAAVALAATACSKTATNTNNTNTSTNTSSTNTTNASATNTNSTSSSSTSPTAVMQASFNAAKNKDVPGFKKTIASADLKEMDAAFSKDGKNADEFLKEMMSSPDNSMPATLETRNEKINGDKATIEYKQKDGSWKTAYLIKEGGEWKMKMGADKDEDTAGKDSGEMKDEHDK